MIRDISYIKIKLPEAEVFSLKRTSHAHKQNETPRDKIHVCGGERLTSPLNRGNLYPSPFLFAHMLALNKASKNHPCGSQLLPQWENRSILNSEEQQPVPGVRSVPSQLSSPTPPRSSSLVYQHVETGGCGSR